MDFYIVNLWKYVFMPVSVKDLVQNLFAFKSTLYIKYNKLL